MRISNRYTIAVGIICVLLVVSSAPAGTNPPTSSPSSVDAQEPASGTQQRFIRREAEEAAGGAGVPFISAPGSLPPPNYNRLTPPPVGGMFVDPVFSTTIRRLTDASKLGADGLVPEYSENSSFNLDDSYVLVYGITSGHFELFDGVGNHLRRLAVFRPRWSRSRPDDLYFVSGGNAISRMNVATGAVVTLRKFNEYKNIDVGNGQGDISDNERVALVGDGRYLFIYDLNKNKKYGVLDTATLSNVADAVSVTPDGDGMVVSWNVPRGTSRGHGAELYDLNGRFAGQLQNAIGHGSLGRDVKGAQVYFVTNVDTVPQQPASGCRNGIVKISLDGLATRTCLLGIVEQGGHWGTEVHMSGLGRDGWVYVSTLRLGAKVGNWTPYDMEIFRVRANGSRVERIAHHRSSAKSYWLQPHASVSISGSKLLFASDFGTRSRPDTYLIDLQPGGGTGLPAPSALRARSVGTSRINLTWQDNASSEDSYEVLRRGPGESSFSMLAFVGRNTTSYADRSASIVGSAYCYKVIAHEDGAASGASNTACATLGSSTSPPAAPSNLSVTAFPAPRVVLEWQDNSSSEDAFEVLRQDPGESRYHVVATLGRNAVRYVDVSVKAGGRYCYRVRALEGGETSSSTASRCATPAGTGDDGNPEAPAAPARLKAKIGNGPSVKLTWADKSDNETRFQVYRQKLGKNYRRIATLAADTTRFTDTDVRSGRTYCYRVFSKRGSPRSPSNEACAAIK